MAFPIHPQPSVYHVCATWPVKVVGTKYRELGLYIGLRILRRNSGVPLGRLLCAMFYDVPRPVNRAANGRPHATVPIVCILCSKPS